MLAFVDFQASSLHRQSHPIEVAWVFEDGRSESWLIRPAPNWIDWDPAAEAVHAISRADLAERGHAYRLVAARMIDQLGGHDLVASAPVRAGRWAAMLLHAGGFARHNLRLRDSEEVQRAAAAHALAGLLSFDEREAAIDRLMRDTDACRRRPSPLNRALPDAEQQRACWLAMRAAAQDVARALEPA